MYLMDVDVVLDEVAGRVLEALLPAVADAAAGVLLK